MPSIVIKIKNISEIDLVSWNKIYTREIIQNFLHKAFQTNKENIDICLKFNGN